MVNDNNQATPCSDHGERQQPGDPVLRGIDIAIEKLEEAGLMSTAMAHVLDAARADRIFDYMWPEQGGK